MVFTGKYWYILFCVAAWFFAAVYDRLQCLLQLSVVENSSKFLVYCHMRLITLLLNLWFNSELVLLSDFQ